MVALDALVMSTALTAIGAEFAASIEALEWTISGYMLPFAVFLIAASGLGDRFGRRRIFAWGLILFAAASAACALAPGIGWLIAARAAQGTAAAMVMPLALTQLSAAFPPERRGWALGVYSGVTALSTVIGPLIGGIITQGLAWQWIFWLNVPVGAVVTVLTFARIRESVGPRAPLDVGGVVLATAAALGLVWGLVRANPAGWSSAEVQVALPGGVALAVAFVTWELRCAAPMVPMRLFRDRTFAASNAAHERPQSRSPTWPQLIAWSLVPGRSTGATCRHLLRSMRLPNRPKSAFKSDKIADFCLTGPCCDQPGAAPWVFV